LKYLGKPLLITSQKIPVFSDCDSFVILPTFVLMRLKTLFFNLSIWWAVIGDSIWVGGTIYMMSVINPQWSSNPPQSVHYFFTHTAFNTYIWYFFGPPFMLIRSILPQSLALLSGWQNKFMRRNLIITTGCTLITIVFTLAYIYPINNILMAKAGGDNPAEAIRSMTSTWLLCDRIRFIINIVGYYFLLRAFRGNNSVN